MPNIRFGWESSVSHAVFGEHQRISSEHFELMSLLELCLTPGCHTIAYESQFSAQESIQRIISIVSPFMHVGLHGFDTMGQLYTNAKAFGTHIIDLSSELIATDIDLAFIHSKAQHQINILDILSCNGTTIIVEIKNQNENK